MNGVKPGGTREQQAVLDLVDRAALVRSQLAATAEQVPAILPYFDRLTEAAASFGLCELHARSLDRSLALDVFEERRPWLETEVARHNEAGIATIGRARSTLVTVRKELDGLVLDDTHVSQQLEEFVQEFRVGLADWEMKGSDAAKLFERLDEVAGVVRSSGLVAITDHLDNTLNELVAVRQRPDRGAVDNIPVWKVILAAGWFGWAAVTAVLAALTGPSPTVNALAVIAFTHVVAFILFC